MRMRSVFTVAVLLLLAGATAVSGQRRPVELGLDAMFAFQNPSGSGNNFFTLDGPIGGMNAFTPMHGLRAAFGVTDLISVEPSLGFNLWSETDNNLGDEQSMSRFGFSTSILVHRSADIDRAVPFVGLGGNFLNFNTSDAAAASQFGAHAFAGVNVPVVDRLAVRFAVGGARFFENDDFDSRWTGFGTVGLSFWPGSGGRVVTAAK
jgi:hypothetical protein